jgi:hypothetical protein
LLQRQKDSEEKKLEEEAKALKEQEEALAKETDLRSILKDAFPKTPVRESADDDFSQQNPSLSQHEMLEVMGEVISKAIHANSQLILNKVGALVKGTDDKIEGTQKAVLGLMSHISVGEAKSKHNDFDAYQDDIVEIMKKTSGLSPEDAYTLAKARRSATVPGRDHMESERPDTTVSRSYSYDDRLETRGDGLDYDDRQDRRSRDNDLPPNPRREYREVCNAAIDKVIANRRGNR